MLSPEVQNPFRTAIDTFPPEQNGPGIVAITEVPTLAQANLIATLAAAAEVRMDFFPAVTHEAQLEQTLGRLAQIPLLGTLRSSGQGGRSEAITPARNRIIRSMFPSFDAIDLEIGTHSFRSLTDAAHDEDCVVVASYHDMSTTPSIAHMERLLESALEDEVDYVKFAVTTNDPDELNRIVEFTHQHREVPIITVSMGLLGATGRRLLLDNGSRATFVYIGDKPVAPGQLSLQELATT